MGGTLAESDAAGPGDTATAIDIDATAAQKPRLQIHERPQLAAFILGKVGKASVPLHIARSRIEDAGSGLFVTKPVWQGQEIFRSHPLILCREAGVDDVCDWCFVNRNGSVHPDGRFYGGEHDERPTISRCAKCKVARYCSQVSSPRPPVFVPPPLGPVPHLFLPSSTPAGVTQLTLVLGLSEVCLGRPPQVRVFGPAVPTQHAQHMPDNAASPTCI